MTSQMPVHRSVHDGAIDRITDTAPTITYDGASFRTAWDAFPATVQRETERVDLGPVLTQVRHAEAIKRSGRDQSAYQLQRGWRMARDGLLVVTATRPLRRRADGRYAPNGQWTTEIEVHRVDAEAGERRVSTLAAPREVEADEAGVSARPAGPDGEDGDLAWRILPVQPRRTLARWVPFASARWRDAVTVLKPTANTGWRQVAWYVRRSDVAVAVIAAARPAGMDGTRRDAPWEVDFYAAPLRAVGTSVAERDRGSGADARAPR